MAERRRIKPVADRIEAREQGHIPVPLAHRPPLEFVLIDRETVLAKESDTDREGEWIETDELVEVLQ